MKGQIVLQNDWTDLNSITMYYTIYLYRMKCMEDHVLYTKSVRNHDVVCIMSEKNVILVGVWW